MPLESPFFVTGGPVSTLPFFYNWYLVGLSLTIAMVCSMAALQVVSFAEKEPRANARQALLLTASISLGFGVWAMHFIGMLSFNVCTAVTYKPAWTAASMVPSLLASYVALRTISNMPRMDLPKLLAAGSVTGAGIGLMHYSGMAAMQMKPSLRYDPTYFALSIVVAILFATFAIWIRFGLASRSKGISTKKLNIISGVVMGLAIAAMHYTGMLAARFIGEPDAVQTGTVDFPTSLALALFASVAVFALMVLGSISVWHYRKLVDLFNLEGQRLATILNSVTVGMITTDQNGCVLEFNNEAQKIFGWTPAQIIGQPISALLPSPADVPGNGRPASVAPKETVALRKGGQRFQAALAWGQAKVHDGVLYIACLSDLTLEKAQRINLERAHSIIEASQDAIISKTLEGIITSWNKGAERMFGYPQAEAIGRSMLFVIPKERSSEEDEFLAKMRRGERIDSFETVRMTKGGKYIDVSVTLSPIRDTFGAIVGISKIARDISDRKAAELLRKERERAEFADAARTELMVSMNHEIRTPLSHIEGFANVLLETPLQAEQVQSVQSIQKSTRQLQKDLNNILESVELSRGRMAVHRARFDVRALLQQVHGAFSQQASDRQLQWVVQSESSEPEIYFGDEAKVRQVLERLVSNAFKFTKEGRVALSLRRTDTHLQIAVSDTGCGMGARELALLFKPLRQADSGMDRQHGGMGMGCALSLQLAQLMGGDIEVQSSLGQGTCLTLCLPLEPASAAAQSPPQEALQKLSILVVDDIPLNLKLVSALLKNEHAVTTALSAQEAFAAMREKTFDLILMDVQMPGMDGLEATREIRRMELQDGTPRVCIVALTANVSESDKRNAMDAGMDGFLGKPFTRQGLSEYVNKLHLAGAR